MLRGRVSGWWIPLGLLLSAPLGCNSILGIEEAEVTPTGGGTGGTAGAAAGASGAGGTAGSVGGASGAAGCTANLDNDPDNCGSCAHSCLGNGCSSGQCQAELVTETPWGAASIALTASAIFWGNTLSGVLYRYDRTTKMTTNTHLGTDVSEVYAEGSDVYAFVDKGDEIFRVPASGGTPQSIIKVGAATSSFGVDQSGVYWVTCPSSSSGEVYRANLDGGGPTKLVDVSLCPLTLRLDATHIYFATSKSSGIYRVSKASPHTPQLIGSANPGSVALFVTDTDVFFADFDYMNWSAGDVYRVPKGGGPPLTIAKDQLITSAILEANGKVYWTNRGTWSKFTDGSVQAAPVQGTTVGSSVALGTGLGAPESLALDATHVYWLLSGSNVPGPGSIWRVAR
ncbi:MAG: hypothetical protein R3B13_12930 [Polyangiaceae bacterium]